MTAVKIKQEMEEKPILTFEKDRLQTFKENWKDLGFKHCTPENFAAAGFYNCSTTPSDAVKCFSCQKELSDWEKDDDPWEEHVRRRNRCPFVLFKSKEKPTVGDFLEMHYETQNISLSSYFETQKKVLDDVKPVKSKKSVAHSKIKI